MKTVTEIVDIEETERAVFVGRTGSGKTLLAKSLLVTYPHVLAIDEKAEFRLPRDIVVNRLDDLPGVLDEMKNRPFHPVIYQPEPEFWNIESYNEVFRLVYLRRHMTVYVDEIYAVMKSLTFPHWYQAVLTRGRSLGIRTISCTQRPSRIPISVLSESEHYAVFQLQMEEDRAKMAGLIGREVLAEKIPEHSFWYYNVGQTGPAERYIIGGNSVSRILSWQGNNGDEI